MWKKILKLGCIAIIIAASIVVAGCPDPVGPRQKPGTNEDGDPSLLGAPSGIRINSGDASLEISWVKVEGATRYQVACTDSDGNEKTIEAKNNQCVITGLSNGIEYSVRIRAGNKKGWSGEWSFTLSGRPKGRLQPPKNVQVNVQDRRIDVTWDAMEDVIFYRVKYSDGVNENIKESDYNRITLTGLTNDVEYAISVQSVNGNEESEFSDPVKGTPFVPLTPPAPPVIDTIKDGTHLGELTLNWEAAIGASKYKVAWNKTGAAPSAAPDVTEGIDLGNVLTFTITGLDHGTLYHVWVAAWNEVGWSEWGTASFTTRPPIVPAVPANFSAVPSNAAVHLHWDLMANADKYEVAYSDDNFVTQNVVNSVTDNVSVTALTNDVEYRFKARAGSSDAVPEGTIGWSAWSVVETAKPEVWAIPPNAPDNVHVQANQRYTLQINWAIPAGANRFQIKYGTSSIMSNAANWKNGADDDWLNPPVLITGLEDSTPYYVWVRAGNEKGYSGWTVGSGTTKTPVIPAVPVNVQAAASQINKMTISWDVVANAAKYQLKVSKEDQVVQTINIPENEGDLLVATATASGLETGSEYTFEVRAGADEWGLWSTAIKGISVVPKPASLTLATGGIIKQLVATWTAVAGADAYNLRCSAANDVDNAASVTGTVNSPKTIAGLEDETLYYVWVRAQAGTGANAHYSDWVQASAKTKTPVLPQGVVSNLKAAAGDKVIDLSWDAVAGATLYEVNYGVAPDYTQTREVSGAASFQMINLTNYSEYNIRVRAGNADGFTAYSKAVTATPALPIPATPVVNLSNAGAFRQLKVEWAAVSNAAKYYVKYSENNDVNAAVHWVPFGITTTFTTITGLQDDTLYYVWVMAENQTGGSSWGTASMKTRKYEPIVAGTPTEIPVFTACAGYEVGGTAADNVTNSWTDSGFTGAVGNWLNQADSDNAPPDGKDKDLLSGVIMIQWKPIEGATSYNVYTSNTTTRPDTPIVNTTRLSYFLRDAAPEPEKHYFWVQAVNGVGPGPISTDAPTLYQINSSKKVQTTSNTLNLVERATFPKNLAANVTAEGTVQLEWDKSDRAVWYEVYYYTEDISINPSLIGDTWTESFRRMVPYKRIPEIQNVATPWNDKTGTPGNVGEIHKIHSCETTVTGLDPAKTYWFWVRSLNHNGERGMAKVGSVQPSLSATGLAAPANVVASAISPGGGKMLKVDWDAVSGASGYRIYFSKYNNPQLTLPCVAVYGNTITTYTLNGLDENYLYYVWVAATSASGQSPFSLPSSAVVNMKDGTEPVSVTKNGVWGTPLRNIVYVEVNNNDPRVALNWELESGEKFFDVVVLFAANLRIRDCANSSAADKKTHRCTMKGPHIHYNGNVQYILENRDKYIKPLQDAGIKVVLGLLGDHDYFIYHNLGVWPFEEIYPWATENNPGKANNSHWWTGDPNVYPFGYETREAFCSMLAAEVTKYGLDGFDLDDEWASDASTKGLSTNATDYNGTDEQNAARNRLIARNYGEFLYIMRQKLGPNKIISLYQWKHISNTYLGAPGATMNIGTVASPKYVPVNPNIWDYVTCSGYASYGGVGAPYAGIPRDKYSPFALDINNVKGAITYNTYTDANPKYGWLLYYNLNTRAKGGSSQMNFINKYAKNLFGKEAVYNGVDYPQDWVKW